MSNMVSEKFLSAIFFRLSSLRFFKYLWNLISRFSVVGSEGGFMNWICNYLKLESFPMDLFKTSISSCFRLTAGIMSFFSLWHYFIN